MVECAGLEIRCTVMPYRGFESHLLRQNLVQNADRHERIRMKNADSRTRRQFIKIGGIVLPLLVVTGRSSAATNASMRSALKYQDTPSSGKSCAGCAQFVPGKAAAGPGGCKIMPGDTEISPQGFCTAWTAKPA